MATGNFNNQNASCIFAVLGDDEFIYDDAMSNVMFELGADKEVFSYNEGSWSGNDGKVFGSASMSDEFCGVDFEVSLKLIMRSGYYEGGNFDYDITVDFANDSQDYAPDFDECYDAISWATDGNNGLASIHAQGLADKVEELLETLRNKVEDVYSMFSDKYEVSARFSNGETMYSKVA